MEINFWDVILCTILNCFIKQLWTNCIAAIWLQHRDSHYVNHFVASFFRLFGRALFHLRDLVFIAARNSSNKNVLVVSQYRIPLICCQADIEIGGINDRECQIIQNSELFDILFGEPPILNLQLLNFALRLLNIGVVVYTVIWTRHLTLHRNAMHHLIFYRYFFAIIFRYGPCRLHIINIV